MISEIAKYFLLSMESFDIPRFSKCETDEELSLVTKTRFSSKNREPSEAKVERAVRKQLANLYGIETKWDVEQTLCQGGTTFPRPTDGYTIMYSEPYCYIRSDCYSWTRDWRFYAKGKLLERLFPKMFYIQLIETPRLKKLYMVNEKIRDIHRGCVMILHIYLPNNMMKDMKPPKKTSPKYINKHWERFQQIKNEYQEILEQEKIWLNNFFNSEMESSPKRIKNE